MARHSDDVILYQQLLEDTRGEEGVEHRDQAVKKLAEELAGDAERLAEFVEAHARSVAESFDRSHKPETVGGQMTLFADTYLAIGASERVRTDHAMPDHTRRWLDIQNLNKAKQDQAHAAKTLRGYELDELQQEQQCSMWVADQILRGEDPGSE